MTLRIYDTASRELRDFVPLKEGHASIYLCGATVQSIPHIGHVRSGVAFDILRNWLTAQGYDVAFVRNVTDIDDKILAKAAENNRPWWEWAATHERAFQEAYRQLGVTPPSLEPRATGHIPEMITYMQRIIDNGHGYAADGNVYAQPASIADYGEISGQKIDELDQGESAGTGKRDPRDFTMWKAVKPGEPSWDSPWGPGRPGWHIECSAMATKYLGPEFDIHAGGLDLQFPHHENENAQAHAAGDPFARYWMHNGWVTMAGEKMSKSLGNTLSVPHILKLIRPVELRYYLGSAHYRNKLDYSEQALYDAATAHQRIENFVNQAHTTLSATGAIDDSVDCAGAWPEEFEQAMNNDLAVPLALGTVHDAVRAGNSALSAGDQAALLEQYKAVRAMTAILGIDPLSGQWRHLGGSEAQVEDLVDGLIRDQLNRREQARADKDWALSDEIRDSLESHGVKIIDTPQGTQWELVE